jgi:hypothetical protein
VEKGRAVDEVEIEMTFELDYYKGTLFLRRTWLSIGDKEADGPEYFTTEDMEALELEPDWHGMAKAENQIREIDACYQNVT